MFICGVIILLQHGKTCNHFLKNTTEIFVPDSWIHILLNIYLNYVTMCIIRDDKMYFEDIRLGMAVNTAPALIKKEKMIAFARDYDNIPLHTEEEYAKTTTFGQLIAPGVMSFMSVWAK